MKIDIGINETDRAAIAQGLGHLLADTYSLYLQTHNFHWNVTGPMFQTLHLMFETQYTPLGYPAPGTYTEFQRLASIKEPVGVPKATEDAAQPARRIVARPQKENGRNPERPRPLTLNSEL